MITMLDLRRGDFGLFMNWLERVLWDNILGRREAQESWLIFRDLF